MNNFSHQETTIDDVTNIYRFKVTPFLENLIHQDTSGTLKKQFYPSLNEITDEDGLADPIGDRNHSPIPGLVHRYTDRALLLVSSECFAYCRFCFRKCMLTDSAPFSAKITDALTYIQNHEEIWEVILSGGDPLTLSNDALAEIISAVQKINHVAVIRIHTRAPVVNPSRIDNRLIDILHNCKKPVYCVLHINHVRELAPEVTHACSMLLSAGVSMLSQSVLLRGINDSSEILSTLMRQLVQNRIKPYYLHNCDLAKGNAHFRVDLETGRKIVSELRTKVSGICLPTFILDIPHGFGKVPASQEYVSRNDHCWQIIDGMGKTHQFPQT